MKKVTKKIKAAASDLMPECERQSTLVVAHAEALQPILDGLPPGMVLELRETVRNLEAKLGKMVRKMVAERKLKITNCFTCDGTGQMCNICGESEAACQCPENDRSTCEDCDGRCQVEVLARGVDRTLPG